jgi:hypothetical protein
MPTCSPYHVHVDLIREPAGMVATHSRRLSARRLTIAASQGRFPTMPVSGFREQSTTLEVMVPSGTAFIKGKQVSQEAPDRDWSLLLCG